MQNNRRNSNKVTDQEETMRYVEITVYGLVQGIGFRPFVAEAARACMIRGTVCNAGGIVKIRAAGEGEALDEFVRRLSSCVLPGSRIEDLVVRDEKEFSVPSSFQIVESESFLEQLRFLPADIATCRVCERELLDPDNRRYRYPFISCVSCGPRFSIMKDIPYDRVRTAMASFSLCEECQNEYTRPGDIRRHAQTIACEKCGPKLRLYFSDQNKEETDSDEPDLTGGKALDQAVKMIREGKVVAVRDIGGFHFCFDPFCEEAAARTRKYKNRERKPFAVMFPDVGSVREYAIVSETEEELLRSTVRPIVLIDKKNTEPGHGLFAKSVDTFSKRIGAMLPCNPLQILLSEALGPLVMTSGNRGSEPIVTDESDMIAEWKNGFPDAVLSHDRDIVNRLDDSICQVTRIPGWSEPVVQILRRARGYVPEPVLLPFSLKEDAFAAGGDLKNTFALGRKNRAYLSGYWGDMSDIRSVKAREDGVRSLSSLMGISLERAVRDMHPGYISSDLAARMKTGSGENICLESMQHHHAHIASVMTEHGLCEPVLGVAFDGTGYGDDGTIWGSEFLICEGREYRRAGHFSSVTMTGGDAASVDARLPLLAYLKEAKDRGLLSQEITDCKECFDGLDAGTVLAALRARVNTVVSSSMGRLFDAVAVLAGITYRNSYEGECAALLQQYAEEDTEVFRFDEGRLAEIAPIYEEDGMWICDSVKTVAELFCGSSYVSCADSNRHHCLVGEESLSTQRLAALFHAAIADATARMSEAIIKQSEEETGTVIRKVALGGGTMCNRLLLQLLVPKLEKRGYKVFLNRQVPPGDGGLCLGQLMKLM